MITWTTDANNDISLANGQIANNQALAALRTRIDAALQIIKGEFDDTTQGVDYFGIIFSDTPLSMKVQEITRVINLIDGVEKVEFKNYSFDNKTQTMTYYFTIYSTYGQFDYNSLFDISA